MGGGFIRIRDTSEVLDFTSTGLLVETFNVTGFANIEGRVDEAFIEVEASFLMDLFSEVSILGVGGDECDEDDLSTHSEELGNLRDSSDVFSTIFSSETEILVKSLSDNITIEDEALLAITGHCIKFLLEAF